MSAPARSSAARLPLVVTSSKTALAARCLQISCVIGKRGCTPYFALTLPPFLESLMLWTKLPSRFASLRVAAIHAWRSPWVRQASFLAYVVESSAPPTCLGASLFLISTYTPHESWVFRLCGVRLSKILLSAYRLGLRQV